MEERNEVSSVLYGKFMSHIRKVNQMQKKPFLIFGSTLALVCMNENGRLFLLEMMIK